jgi:hypothetical protein
MKTRVKAFYNINCFDMEEQVNEFLKKTSGTYLDLRFQSNYDHDGRMIDYCAFLVYTTKKEENAAKKIKV